MSWRALSSISTDVTERAAAVEWVHREKALDNMARNRLAARYGSNESINKRNEKECNGKRSCKCLTNGCGWTCNSCGKVSYDARLICGYCLAVSPSVMASVGASVDKKNVGGTSGMHVVPVHNCRDDGISHDSSIRVVRFPQNRCYRIFATEGHARGNESASAEVVDSAPDSREVVGEGSASKRKYAVETDESGEKKVGSTFGGRVGKHFYKKPYTHFIALPIGKVKVFGERAEALLGEMKQCCVDPANGVTEEIFTSAPRTHLTLLMLSLPTCEDVALAVECMRVLQDQIYGWKQQQHLHEGKAGPDDSAGIPIRLGGLHVMTSRGQHMQKANVLYMGLADEESTATVRALQDIVHSSFGELICDDPRVSESKLLHVTLMNTKWRTGEGKQQSGGKNLPFNASEVLRRFANVSLCESPVFIDKVELCALGYDSVNECYPCEAVVYL